MLWEWKKETVKGLNITIFIVGHVTKEGVGAAQIYPVWNGGGTVKISIVEEWRTAHPEGTPKDCRADTGISKNTV